MLLIFCFKITPRIRYVFDWVFGQWGIKYTVTESVQAFQESDISKIYYSKENLQNDNSFWVGDNGFLQKDDLTQPDITISHIDGVPCFFKNEGDAGFDVFSAIFYMLSRYEEYLPFEADVHGRFPASESLAFKNGFLEFPVVDMWLHSLKNKIKNRYPELVFQEPYFESKVTYDIDANFKFKGRSFSNNLLALGKDLLTLQWKNLADRISVLSGSKDDPWDIYEKLTRLTKGYEIDTLFFFLCTSGTQFDRNLSFDHPSTTALLDSLKKNAEPGLHPSYYSSGDAERLQQEKEMLEEKLGETVFSSRQHFLRFSFPVTFNTLLASGIRNEYSILFPDAPGFRAGTAKPFYFYDLQEEKETELKFFPGCWMDSIFVHYRREDAERAFVKAKELMDRIQQYGGIFIPVFHNNYLSEASWFQAHHRMMKEISKRISK